MSEKEYRKWLRRIEVLMRKKNKIKEYNLIYSCSCKECAPSYKRNIMYSYDEVAGRRKSEIERMISSILEMLKAEGYDPETIMKKYEEITNDEK